MLNMYFKYYKRKSFIKNKMCRNVIQYQSSYIAENAGQIPHRGKKLKQRKNAENTIARTAGKRRN